MYELNRCKYESLFKTRTQERNSSVLKKMNDFTKKNE